MTDDFWSRFALGANVPPELAWQEGKTAASIQWVRYLEGSNSADASPYRSVARDPLVDAIIQSFKSGEIVASKFPPDMT